MWTGPQRFLLQMHAKSRVSNEVRTGIEAVSPQGIRMETTHPLLGWLRMETFSLDPLWTTCVLTNACPLLSCKEPDSVFWITSLLVLGSAVRFPQSLFFSSCNESHSPVYLPRVCATVPDYPGYIYDLCDEPVPIYQCFFCTRGMG